ncbi:hypothetical protein QBC44DRAFT_311629 [Cladorrhinum sp. PSN332]|nr:hypothetical protein QBC44DRAFT_311629 [Cladorrhinum sp. PSN332]
MQRDAGSQSPASLSQYRSNHLSDSLMAPDAQAFSFNDFTPQSYSAQACVPLRAGFFTAVRNQRMYSSTFSSILRVTHNMTLSQFLEMRDADGKSPLPKRVAETTVTFPPWLDKGSRRIGTSKSRIGVRAVVKRKFARALV